MERSERIKKKGVGEKKIMEAAIRKTINRKT